MKFLIILCWIFAVATAQRPSFAGVSPKGYPEVASRFRDTSSGSSSLDVGNRLGETFPSTTSSIQYVDTTVPVSKPSYSAYNPKDYPDFVTLQNTLASSTGSSPDIVNRAGEGSSTTTTTVQASQDSGVGVLASGQRPSFAGLGPKGYPVLGSRFKDTSIPDIVDRIGEGGSSTTEKIAVVADDFVERVKQWPRENQPFWVLNAQHIEQHLHPERQQGQQVETRANFGDDFVETRPARPTAPRPSFAGRR